MKAIAALRRIIGLWDSLDAVGSEEPAEPYKEQMDDAVNDARKVLEDAYREAAADPDYQKDMRELTDSPAPVQPPREDAPSHEGDPSESFLLAVQPPADPPRRDRGSGVWCVKCGGVYYCHCQPAEPPFEFTTGCRTCGHPEKKHGPKSKGCRQRGCDCPTYTPPREEIAAQPPADREPPSVIPELDFEAVLEEVCSALADGYCADNTNDRDEHFDRCAKAKARLRELFHERPAPADEQEFEKALDALELTLRVIGLDRKTAAKQRAARTEVMRLYKERQ